MKKKLCTSALLLAVMIVSIVSLSGCTSDSGFFMDPITSYNWELTAVNNRPVSEIDVCEFQFFENGDGTYGRYNEYGRWETTFIQWEDTYAAGGAQYLYIYPPEGGRWEYLMRFYGGSFPMLELNDLMTGDCLTFSAY